MDDSIQDHTAQEADESIIARVVAGETDSYRHIMARYEMKLRRYVVVLIHNPTMAEDIVQETFIKAYRSLKGFNPKYKFSSWIYRIAHNEAMNAIKAQRHMVYNDIETLPDELDVRSIEALVDRRILEGNVWECLGALDAKYREVVQLVYCEHMKYEEVADILHIPASTVGVWLSRAKKRLRGICEQKGVKS